MKRIISLTVWLAMVFTQPLRAQITGPGPEPAVPGFSVDYMDRSVSPATNFYRYACGTWLRNNPIPADKARWGGFMQLAERNLWQLHELLVAAAADPAATPGTPRREIGDFFAAAMDTNRIEALGFQPISADLARIAALQSTAELLGFVADFQREGNGLLFGSGVGPDDKDSSTYVFQLSQGGLSLPDRDYYLKDDFAPQR